MSARLHPFCNVCGWRKGGVDSWDGRRCKCGLSEPPFPEPSEVTPIRPAPSGPPCTTLDDETIRAVVRPRAKNARLQAALSAHALEEDRGRDYADYEREQIARDGFRLDRPYKEPFR